MKQICRCPRRLRTPLCRALALFTALIAGCAPRAKPTLSGVADSRSVPVVMYHSVLRDPAKTGKYVVTPASLKSDLAWLIDHGYTSVTARALVDFVSGRGTLPEKPVLITFDDGYLNNLTYALPLLTDYDCTAVVAVVGEYAARFSETPDPNPNYAHLSWEELYALVLSGRFELANHTYAMHALGARKGSARKAGESDAAYAEAFCADVERLQRELARRTQTTPLLFAYPYGMMDPDSRALLLNMGFAGSLSCNERVSRVVAGDPDSLWALGRFNRDGALTTEAFMRRMLGE